MDVFKTGKQRSCSLAAPSLRGTASRATRGAAGTAGRALRACEAAVALMTEGREKLFDLGCVTRRTADLLVAVHQHFKVLIAFHAVIFEDRHIGSPMCLRLIL